MWPTRETCTRPGTLSASFGTHDEISQVSTVPTDAQNATILELSADMIPNPGAFVRMNFIFFRNRLLNLAVSLMRHRANRASTLYCLSEAKSHAGICGNVANSQLGLAAGAGAAQPTGSQSIQQRQARPLPLVTGAETEDWPEGTKALS